MSLSIKTERDEWKERELQGKDLLLRIDRRNILLPLQHSYPMYLPLMNTAEKQTVELADCF